MFPIAYGRDKDNLDVAVRVILRRMYRNPSLTRPVLRTCFVPGDTKKAVGTGSKHGICDSRPIENDRNNRHNAGRMQKLGSVTDVGGMVLVTHGHLAGHVCAIG